MNNVENIKKLCKGFVSVVLLFLWWVISGNAVQAIDTSIVATGTLQTSTWTIVSGQQQISLSITGDKEYLEALDWMYSYGLSKYRTAKEYKGEDMVTREQAAKFYTQFAVNVLYKVIDMTKYCEFTDLKDADPSLRNSILTSCLLHLFHGKQNKFFPLQNISKAEALAVLIRAVDGIQDEVAQPRYIWYHKKALELKLTKQSDSKQLESPLSRYEMALLLYRASKKKWNP